LKSVTCPQCSQCCQPYGACEIKERGKGGGREGGGWGGARKHRTHDDTRDTSKTGVNKKQIKIKIKSIEHTTRGTHKTLRVKKHMNKKKHKKNTLKSIEYEISPYDTPENEVA
jgi:hypothetical protein